MKKLFLSLIFLFIAVQVQAQNNTTLDNNGWDDLRLKGSIWGCTEARVDSTRKAYIERGKVKGNLNAAEEFPIIEEIVRDEFKKSCECIYRHISAKWTYSEYMQNMQTIAISPFMEELVNVHNGKCAPNEDTFKARILKRKNEIDKIKKANQQIKIIDRVD
ncbi:MAG: hypothetical protein QMD97_05090 [Candidatus Aenigmarchaeota archaeon]|nr:hypothetical protein [Candidatus Aenigmarchaeota archaeon]